MSGGCVRDDIDHLKEMVEHYRSMAAGDAIDEQSRNYIAHAADWLEMAAESIQKALNDEVIQ